MIGHDALKLVQLGQHLLLLERRQHFGTTRSARSAQDVIEPLFKELDSTLQQRAGLRQGIDLGQPVAKLGDGSTLSLYLGEQSLKEDLQAASLSAGGPHAGTCYFNTDSSGVRLLMKFGVKLASGLDLACSKVAQGTVACQMWRGCAQSCSTQRLKPPEDGPS
jgi:hypothetical protein